MKFRSATDRDLRWEEPIYSSMSTVAQGRPSTFPTTPGERFLLFATVLVFPLESHIPPIAGFSSLYLVFAVLAGYVAIHRLWCLDRIWMHPVFISAYVFIGMTVAIEFANPFSSYEVIGRFAMVIGGALVVASLCRDRLALKMLLYGYIGAALWLGAVLFLTSYGTLSAIKTTDFREASQARAEIFSDTPIKGNINGMAFNCVQGGIVALAFALGAVSLRRRNLFLAISIFCLVSSSLPMSRGAIVNALLSCGVLLKADGIRQGKVWLLSAVLVVSAFIFIPDAIWSRMAFMNEGVEKEGRAALYESALEQINEYLFMGVGSGNFIKKWGFQHGFAKWDGLTYSVYGAHNIFLQLMIYWGLIGLSSFLVLIWLSYRCLPSTYRGDALALGILGVAVSTLLFFPFTSDVYQKGFSLVLGMLVAHHCWLSPKALAKLPNRAAELAS